MNRIFMFFFCVGMGLVLFFIMSILSLFAPAFVAEVMQTTARNLVERHGWGYNGRKQ